MTSEWKTDTFCRRIFQADKEHVTSTAYRIREFQCKMKMWGPLFKSQKESVIKATKIEAFPFSPVS